jgi:alpha-ketoglutarate-dependent taurine dioxygenase
VHHNVYTSTDYPADQAIFPHNENSYQRTFPLKLFFYCHVAPEGGGETPLVDCRRVGQRIPAEIRRRFATTGIRYVRNFGGGMGLDWRSVFQTDDRGAIEAYCRGVDMQLEWRPNDRLRVSRVLPATVRHPRTGEEIWFNHATFFHLTTLPETLRDTLAATLAEGDLPNQTYYGDGSPIEDEVVAELRRIYLDEKVVYPWQRGDVVLLDNVLTAHAREPYRGRREILTGMAEPRSRDAT